MARVPWTLVLTDLQGRLVGEVVNAKSRTIAFPLRGGETIGFNLNLDNDQADFVLSEEGMVKAYEGTDLRAICDILTAEEVAQGGQDDGIAVTCASPLARLGDPGRLLGKSAVGFTASGDRGTIARSILTTANAEQHTGIGLGTWEASASDTVGPWYFKAIAEAILEMGNALDGYDWDFTYVDPGRTPSPASGFYNPAQLPQVALFNVYGVKGFFRANSVFEYGTGRHNVKGYRRPRDRTGQLNRGFSLPQGFPEPEVASTIIQVDDLDSQQLWGMREGNISTDSSVDLFRQKLVEEHVSIRSQPRELIIFESRPYDEPDAFGNYKVPRFKVDYDVGDVVPARAVRRGKTRFDGYFRIYGVSIALDDTSGLATPTLQLTAS